MSILKPRKNRRKEVWGLFFIILGILILISLFTHDLRDLTPGNDVIYNRIGVVGAYSSFAIFYIFGYLAYLLPLILFAIAIAKFSEWDNLEILARLSGVLLTLTALCALLSLIFYPAKGAEPSTYILRCQWGGGLGLLVSDISVRVLGKVGSYILASAVILFSIVLYTNLSAAKVALFGIDRAKKLGKSSYQRLQEARKKAAEQKGVITSEPPALEESEEGIAEEEDFPSGQVVGKVIPRPPDSSEVETEELVAYPDDREAVQSTADISKLNQKILPPLKLLTDAESTASTVTDDERRSKAKIINATLREYGVNAQVVSIGQSGPRLTCYEVEIGAGQRVAHIENLEMELALALKVDKVRISAGSGAKGTIGIEAPNDRERIVTLKEIVGDKTFRSSEKPLPIALGLTMDGKPAAFDLSAMPHLLIAGATGSGKSVFLNSLIISLIFRLYPQDIRFILIDQKKVELGFYDTSSASLPHLLFKVVKSPDGACAALTWCVSEMETRYQLLADTGARNIEGYNLKMAQQSAAALISRHKLNINHPTFSLPAARLPYIVLIVDELSDLMAVKGRQVEEPLTRLAQMARAVGIHLVVATQRPSVDVVTGLIKANFPTRLSFKVTSKVDSRTILDRNGAENLLGRGDFLFLPVGAAEPIRIQAAFISPEEINAVVKNLYASYGAFRPPLIEKEDEFVHLDEALSDDDRDDELLEEARQIVIREGKASISLLQRKLSIGYARAGRLIDFLEREGVVGPDQGSKARKVLVSSSEIPPGGSEEI